MLVSIFANLGVILFMHLIIDQIYSFKELGKLSSKLTTIIHIVFVAFTQISLFYFPIHINGYAFNLGMVALVMVSFLRGPYFVAPITVLMVLWRIFMGGDYLLSDIFLTIFVPIVVGLLLYPKDTKTLTRINVVQIYSVVWATTQFPYVYLQNYSLGTKLEVLLANYLLFIGTALIVCQFSRLVRKKWTLMSKLAASTEYDSLTELYNMRKFDQVVGKYDFSDKKCYIAMVDIDRFKKVNDLYGHEAGNRAIRLVADIFKKYNSSRFISARYGGDEYIFLLATNQLEEAKNILQDIIDEVERTQIFVSGTTDKIKLSVSVGMAEIKSYEDLPQSIKEADEQLYISKTNGRNQLNNAAG